MSTRLRWIAGFAVAAAAFAAVPAQAHTDVDIGVSLGAPYYAPPPPRYYERDVVYEEPRYYEPAVVYEHRYCPPRRVYYRPYERERIYYRHYRRVHRDWDDD